MDLRSKRKTTKIPDIASNSTKKQEGTKKKEHKSKPASKKSKCKKGTTKDTTKKLHEEEEQDCPCGKKEPNCQWDKPPLLLLEQSWNEEKKKVEVPWIQCDSCNTWWHLHCSGLVDSNGKFLNLETFLCIDCHIKNSCIPIKILASRYKCKTSTTESCIKPAVQVVKHTIEEKASPNKDKSPELTSPETNNKDLINKTANSENNNTQSEYNSTEYIVIIDQIDSAFRTSTDIRKEINKVYPEIAPKFCYPLPKGGIAIHLNSKEEEQVCLNDWPPGSFRTERKVKPHKPKTLHKSTVVAKNIEIDYSEESIQKDLQNRYKEEFKVTRIYNPHTNTVYPVVKITTKKDLGKQFLNQGVIILNKYYHCEALVSNTPTRCYKCQKFGHIAKHCFNTLKCALCSGNHSKVDCKEKSTKCSNCSENHPAYRKDCKVYIQKLQELNTRRIAERQYHANHQ